MALFPQILRWALLLALLTSLPALAQQRGVTVELKAREDRRAPVVARVELYPRSHALVIGNDDYRDPFWARLSNGVRDARAVAAALEAKGFEVTLATDLDGDALEEALETFFFERGQDFEARLFVWYAGHGHTEAGEGYLVPVDAPDPAESAGFRRTALSLRRMGEYARGANAHHVLAVFDSCFAGTVFEVQRNAPPAAITHATTRPVRQFITSGDAGQTVSDDGTFRRIFIEAIGGERRADLNADGYVTASELGLFLADSITNYSNGAQTPRYGKLRDPNWDQGDFVFSLGAPRAAPRLAALTPPDTPAFAVDERDETLTALKNANVRSEPATRGAKLTTLTRGSAVAVTGQVQGRDWLRIALADGRTGYVWARLLGEKPAEPDAARRPVPAPDSVPPPEKTPAKPTDPFAVVLDSGLTLGDWTLLAEDRLQRGDRLAVLTQAAGYRQRYGGFEALDGLLERGLVAELKDLSVGSEADARKALPVLAKLERIAGPSLELLEKLAATYHWLEDYEQAEAAYRAWIGRAPADHPDRKQMALGLFKARKSEPFAPQVGSSFRDCAECPEMVVLPAGSFIMGSPENELWRDDDEGPQRPVTIPAAFAVGRYEVTRGEFAAFVSATGHTGDSRGCYIHTSSRWKKQSDKSWSDPGYPQTDRDPVACVSWIDAKAYVGWLSTRTGLSYRLLSEAEWEYAARAGTTTRYAWGGDEVRGFANCRDCGSQWDGKQTAPVGSFSANAFGLHDMHGNLSEWVEDCWHDSYSSAPSDGSPWTTGSCKRRVLRGGSWYGVSWSMRPAHRHRHTPDTRSHDQGFRVSRTLAR